MLLIQVPWQLDRIANWFCIKITKKQNGYVRNWEFTNYTCKEMYVSHIAFFIKWLSQSAHSQSESSQNGLQPTFKTLKMKVFVNNKF